MAKKQFYRQKSIDDGRNVDDNYEDDHMQQFYRLIFDELLFYVKRIAFDGIIQNNLQYNNAVYNLEEANSLFWLYRADRILIDSKTVYSFRFANACHPELYKTFEIKSHHLFQSILQQRHGFNGWYKYIGNDLPSLIDKYLNIRRVVQNQNPHTTNLFINQKKERLDIEFNFESINERITITFEPGYPA